MEKNTWIKQFFKHLAYGEQFIVFRGHSDFEFLNVESHLPVAWPAARLRRASSMWMLGTASAAASCGRGNQLFA